MSDQRQAPPQTAAKPSSAKQVRFFFALRPDEATAGELAALAQDLARQQGGRALAAEDIHLTLAFIGSRDRADQELLVALLNGLSAPSGADGSDSAAAQDIATVPPIGPGPIRLERLGTFGRGLLWIGPPASALPGQDGNGPAGPIADEIRARLRAAGISFDERPLVLHATLVRGARKIPDVPMSGIADRKIIVADDDTTVDPAYIARAWSLALGFSGDRLPAGRRYRWLHPMPQCLA